MVFVEIPFWVVHDSGLVGPTTSSSDALGNGIGSSSDENERCALKSLEMLLSSQNGSIGSNSDDKPQITGKPRKKCAVYSLDIHPDGTKFATAGGDGTVRIWATASLFLKHPTRPHVMAKYDADNNGAYVSTDYGSSSSSASHSNSASDDSDEGTSTNGANGTIRTKKNSKQKRRDDESKTQQKVSILNDKKFSQPDRLLCTLSAHTGSSVLIVRFSNNGKYLASAADDACVCIYAPPKKDSNSDALLVKNTTNLLPSNKENWTRIRLCRGHGLDVVDLAWSPDDLFLVSCSLDSETPIIVWNVCDLESTSSNSAKMISKPYKILGVNVHTSTVKGVAFDPAGSYLASSGDDPAVCIWRTAHGDDDWELEQRIDASAGIFRTWSTSSGQDNTSAIELSNQSLFRRISWSTDGSFLCSTNSVIKNKHVLSTITRGEWKTGENTANLVGHKQPVVVCRHSPHLLSKKSSNVNDDPQNDASDDDEPDFATLLALGDRRGFVTVWTTKKPRPIFKLQCSESRCTVTDLAWGKCAVDDDLFLLVSLLDGQVITIKFAVPKELGPVLSIQEKAKVFQLRYGIDILDGGGGSHLKRFFIGGGGTGQNKLIENAVQMSLEDQNNQMSLDTNDEESPAMCKTQTIQPESTQRLDEGLSIKNMQEETVTKNGKKRVRPVLITQTNDGIEKRQKPPPDEVPKEDTTTDPLKKALEVADRANTVAAASAAIANSRAVTIIGDRDDTDTEMPSQRSSQSRVNMLSTNVSSNLVIPPKTHRIISADLPLSISSQLLNENGDTRMILIVEARNTAKVPIGSKGISVPCIEVSIVKNGRITWKDEIIGASCTSISASHYFFTIGMADGSIQVYGTSREIGWSCGNGFRSHPPLIVLNGYSVVSLQLKECQTLIHLDNPKHLLELLVVGADGSFAVYTLFPNLTLRYKGTLMPTMLHMSSSSGQQRLPKMSRIYITDKGRLVLILSLQANRIDDNTSNMSSTTTTTTMHNSVGAGGSLQAYVYDQPSEMWMRISDSRFLLSDFYSSLPNVSINRKYDDSRILAQLDDSVLHGSLQSTLNKQAPGHRRSNNQHRSGDGGGSLLIYSHQASNENEDNGNYIPTRSHCEDRMSCALVLESPDDFKYWLHLYTQTLVRAGNGSQLRILADMLLGRIDKKMNEDGSEKMDDKHSSVISHCCWWLADAPSILGLDRRKLVKSIVIPEMSKNRTLQRVTNELSIEIGHL